MRSYALVRISTPPPKPKFSNKIKELNGCTTLVHVMLIKCVISIVAIAYGGISASHYIFVM